MTLKEAIEEAEGRVAKLSSELGRANVKVKPFKKDVMNGFAQVVEINKRKHLKK